MSAVIKFRHHTRRCEHGIALPGEVPGIHCPHCAPLRIDGKAQCSRCKRRKDAAKDFHRRSDGRGPRSRCKVCEAVAAEESKRRKLG